MIIPEGEWMLIFKLGLAVGLGALIGLERELNKHPAGLRTHILVSMGAAMFMLIGIEGGGGELGTETSRVAAGVVTGIGFLGAGAIMKEGVNVRGLTTAASIWVTAAVGLCAGAGLFALAVTSTILGVGTLVILNKLELRLRTKTHSGTLVIRGRSMEGIPNMVNHILQKNKAWISHSSIERSEGRVTASYRIELPIGQNRMVLLKELTADKRIEKITWD